MNKREAKREACRRAASVINGALRGWEELDEYGADRQKVVDALYELVAELERRSEPTTRRPPRKQQRQEFMALVAAAIQRRKEATP